MFDELHKYRHWRNCLKGVYDGRRTHQQILVTGSGRLDLYRFGGDSLQGRYHLLRLHPLSAAELGIETSSEFEQLLTLGGFPEPFLGGSEVEAKRWSRDYRTLLIRKEVTSLERVQDLGHLELMVLRLPELVGSPLSINALREDLQVSHKTVSSWLQVLERLFVLFRLAPFGAPRVRNTVVRRALPGAASCRIGFRRSRADHAGRPAPGRLLHSRFLAHARSIALGLDVSTQRPPCMRIRGGGRT